MLEGAPETPREIGRLYLPRSLDGAGALTRESVSDGTGVGAVAGFAWAVAFDSELGEVDNAALVQHVGGLGWTQGDVRADRAELGGLIAQLRRAGSGRVRLLTDCLAMALLARWAERAPTTAILRHEHRVLLLEWRALVKAREEMEREATERGEAGSWLPVELGWIRGHTGRSDGPMTAQDWCDRAAPEAARTAEMRWDAPASEYEATFMLWDAAWNRPVWGGWRTLIRRRMMDGLRARLLDADRTESECGTWLRLRSRWF